VENLLKVRREKTWMVHASFTMSNFGTESSLEPLEITTHFSLLPTGNNNNNNNHKR
jgi:hypothetical protein